MNESANVTSIDAVLKFVVALRKFEDEAARAVLMVDEQTLGAQQWIEHEAPVYWREQIRKCYNEVARARAALDTAKMKGVAGHRPACVEEQNNLRKAQARLRHAQEMIDVVRRWIQRVNQAVDDYRGRIMGFRYCLEAELPRSMAMLERWTDALQNYVDRPVEDSEATPGEAPPMAPSSGEAQP